MGNEAKPMASIRKKHTDAVIVGFGWTGAIMAIELANAGLDVVALERGDNRDTIPDFAYPQITDEVKYSARQALLQNLAKTTVTIRHTKGDVALPYRQFGSFKPGEGVGGAGTHWSGVQSRVSPDELRLYSRVKDRYGEKFIPADMNLQDWGVTYDELEPHFDRFEYVCGTSGKGATLSRAIAPANTQCRRLPITQPADCSPPPQRAWATNPSRCQQGTHRPPTRMNTDANWDRAISAASAVITDA
jgi:choline dehydrogenase-like flavoprotein